MFESRDHVKKFFKYMNSRHPNIQFTCEVESNNKIYFLDISVTRINNKLTTSLYCKKTFSGVYLNFNSFLPMDYKKGLIHTLLFHVPYVLITLLYIPKLNFYNQYGKETLFHFSLLTKVSKDF